MSFAFIVLDTRFLAQIEDAGRWEERFDLLVNELREEYGPSFYWADTGASPDTDVLFLLYPPAHHERVVAQRILESFVHAHPGRITQVHVIVIGRNSRDAKVNTSDIVDLVNAQCIPHGLKAEATRVLRPEDLDDAVRATLVRLLTRRQGGAPPSPNEVTLADSPGVTSTSLPRPPYESTDL